MKKEKIKANYPAALIGLVVLIVAGSYIVYTLYIPPGNFIQNQSRDVQPTPNIPVLTQATSSVDAPSAGSPQDPGSPSNLSAAGPRALVPVDTSVPIRDPMPGIRYFFDRDNSGKTIVLAKGEIVEINLGFAPGLAMRWIVPVSGCGIELVNDGVWYTGGDFWNNTGFYRARYRAVSPGTSVINGKLVIRPEEAGDLRFNLTVIVK